MAEDRVHVINHDNTQVWPFEHRGKAMPPSDVHLATTGKFGLPNPLSAGIRDGVQPYSWRALHDGVLTVKYP